MIPAPRQVSRKTVTQIAAEWDALADARADQLREGADLSYSHVVVPAMLELLRTVRPHQVLDIGCGVGVLTEQLVEMFPRVVALDPSAASVAIARARLDAATGAEFHAESLEDFASRSDARFDLLVANLTLMDVPNLAAVVSGAASLSRPGTTLVFSITHPWFWPVYRGYADAPWFRYEDEISIEAEFMVSRSRTASVTTHIHRPLHMYFGHLAEHGFVVSQLVEPLPTAEVEAQFPAPWLFPRFLLALCRYLPSSEAAGG